MSHLHLKRANAAVDVQGQSMRECPIEGGACIFYVIQDFGRPQAACTDTNLSSQGENDD